jgi:hypothetical protein
MRTEAAGGRTGTPPDGGSNRPLGPPAAHYRPELAGPKQEMWDFLLIPGEEEANITSM